MLPEDDPLASRALLDRVATLQDVVQLRRQAHVAPLAAAVLDQHQADAVALGANGVVLLEQGGRDVGNEGLAPLATPGDDAEESTEAPAEDGGKA